MKPASWLFAIASAIAGILDLHWTEFEPAHQPIQAWSDHIPLALVCIAALWLIAAGAAILVPLTARAGAAALAVLYAIFCFFPLPRLISAPHYLGHSPAIYIGVLVSVAQQLILFIAAACLWSMLSDRPARRGPALAARGAFALCCIDFGLNHFTALKPTAAMIPAWMPFSPAFWAMVTGAAFVLAGAAIALGLRDVLAGRLLAVMLFFFSVLVLTPRAMMAGTHVAWGGDAYNLTAAGAAWIMSAWLAQLRRTAAASDRSIAAQTASA